MDITHLGQQFIFYFDVFVEFLYISLFIAYIRIIIISCIHLCYLHGSDFTFLCSLNIVLVLFIFYYFVLCMFLLTFLFFFWLRVLGFVYIFMYDSFIYLFIFSLIYF